LEKDGLDNEGCERLTRQLPSTGNSSNRVRRLWQSVQWRLLRSRRIWLAIAFLLIVAAFVGWLLWPDPYLAAAERALERRNYAEASAILEEGLKRRPRDTRLLFLAARTARRASRFEQAQDYLRACQRLQAPTDAIDLELALMRVQQGDLEVEDYLLGRVAREDPDTLLIWEVLIQQYLDTYRLYKARDCLDLFLERRPDDVSALLGRGYVWERLFLYSAAVRDYRRAVQVEPANDNARLRLAETLLITGPPEEAAEQFEELSRRHPDSTDARLGLARAWRQQGRGGQAERLLDALLAEHAQNVAALTERGVLAMDARELGRAEDLLRRALALAPFDRMALYNLCQCMRLSGHDAEVREYQARLDRLDTDLKRLGQLTKDALKDPRDPVPRYEAGLIFLRSGEEQEGVRWLNMALHEAPGYRPAHRALADYYQRTGQSELAARHSHLAEKVERAP
jgi:tetratricopeptide (TPR) repeat protein